MFELIKEGVIASLCEGYSVFDYFPKLAEQGVWAVLGGIIGWLIMLLPSAIITIRNVKAKENNNGMNVVYLSIAYFGVASFLTSLSETINNPKLITVLFILNFVILWGLAMTLAIRLLINREAKKC